MVSLAELALEDAAGAPVRLGDVVDRPTVVDLVRYYGCAPCRAQLAVLADRHQEITERGGAVLGIGPAAPYQAALLARRGMPFPLLLDPGRSVGAAIGLPRQSLTRFVFDVRGWWRWLASWFRRGRQGATTAGWGELPAVLVLDAQCRVEWVHRGEHLGENPAIEATLAALDRAVGAS
jgi:hypothetical protein